MFALPVVRYNIKGGYYGYSELYELINGSDHTLSQKEMCEDFINKMQAMFDTLGVPKSLSVFGVSQDRLHICEIMQGMQGAFDQNPVPLKVEDVGAIIKPFFN